MIELKIVKEQYQKMPDSELIRFAENESASLTLESFHLLKAEFEARNLDLGVIESAQFDRELTEATKLSNFEMETAVKFEEAIWKFAFDEKEKGTSDEHIFHALLKKNIKEEYAYMLIQSLEHRAKELFDHFENQIIVGWVLLIAGGIIFFLMINSAMMPVVAIWGVLLAVGGFVRLYMCYDKKRKFQAVLKSITEERENQNNLYQ
jgi:hypothetical protein